MDIRRKLAVTLAAMALVGQMGAVLPVAAASPQHIEALQTYLEAGDLAGLASFIELNPELLALGTPLSALLVEFLAQFRSNPLLVTFPPTILAEIEVALNNAGGASLY